MFIPPGYANVRFKMQDSTNSHLYMCGWGVQLEAADPVEVAGEAGEAWEDNIAEFVSEECTNGTVDLVIGTSDPAEPIISGGVIFVPGTATADSAPPNVALLARKRTGQGGRKNIGRMYVPKPTEGGFDGAGRLSGGQYGAWQTACSDFLAAMNAIPGVAGSFLLHTLEADEPTELTAFEGQEYVATQRRRLR